jgi:hypothetical protein
MKNIHLIPTDKPSRLWTNNLRRRLWLDEFPEQHPTNIAKHIYITNDEEIKEGDWYIDDGNQIRKSITSDKQYWSVRKDYKKIILTTDQDLIKDGIQPIDDEFLEWFVKNPSCEDIEIIPMKLPHLFMNGYKIIIPQEEHPNQIKCYCGHTSYCDCSPLEEPKQETLEEAAINCWAEGAWDNRDGFTDGFVEGAKWQQERMYSEEEIFNLCRDFAIFVQQKRPSYKKQLDWFEQFKKK